MSRRPTSAAIAPVITSAIIIAFIALVGLIGCGERNGQSLAAPAAPAGSAPRRNATDHKSPITALSASAAEGFARAMVVRPFTFPADHGAHPDFALEWWYLTGNLRSADGQRFGYQLTFFRRAVAPAISTAEPPRASRWATRQVYLAHFALTDVVAKAFFASERSARGALGLAGARSEPFRVWLEDWAIGTRDPTSGAFPARARAQGEGFAIDLTLEPVKPPVLNGDQGLSAKGSAPGNASYYYSMSRLASRGTVSVGARTYTVTGASWLDREWSTSLLEPEQVGWDWFALQLSDGRDLMIFQVRRRDGTIETASHGSLIANDGSVQHLRSDDFTIEVKDHWRSRTGIRYPSAWRLTIPSAEVDLRVIPRLADQELDLSFRYWEGAVAVHGTTSGSPVAGEGYVELVGYPAESGS